MIAPYVIGPMALKGVMWYQGESNVGFAKSYAVNFPNMITNWREEFNNPALWFGFIQTAGFCYPCWDSRTTGLTPNTQESLAAADLRQSQLAALQLANVGMSTAVDTGDFQWIHPPDKQNPASRLAKQALKQVYGFEIPNAEFPMFAGSKYSWGLSGELTVSVDIRAGGNKVSLTTDPPPAATASSNPGGFSIARNECVTAYNWGGRNKTFPEYCGYPMIICMDSSQRILTLNATTTLGPDGSSILLTVTVPNNGSGVTVLGSSYGRAAWPMTVFFAHGLLVIPWYSSITAKNPWTPLEWVEDKVSFSKAQWLTPQLLETKPLPQVFSV